LANGTVPRPHLSAFQGEENFWTEAALVQSFAGLISTGKVATGQTNALVPLVFEAAGYLYSPQAFNRMQDSLLVVERANALSGAPEPAGPAVYFTEAATYSRVANASLIGGPFGMLEEAASSGATALHVYDPYALPNSTTQPDAAVSESAEPTEPSGTTNAMGPTPPLLWVADVLTGSQISGFSAGHAAIVTRLNTGANTGGDPTSQQTKTMEALKDANGNSANEVIERPFGTYFMHTNVDRLNVRRRNSTTWSRRTQAVGYARAQDPDDYRWWTPKWTSGKWYCSKLVWKAYEEKVQINIDTNSGYFVLPLDVRLDWSLSDVYNWQR
jgi:hypothetical protein